MSITFKERLTNQACCLLIFEAPAEVCTCQENNMFQVIMVHLCLSSKPCSTEIKPLAYRVDVDDHDIQNSIEELS